MEELNKTQIVLLTLLVSFVTSIATGIATVSLMEQAPADVTRVINRVVERTVETVAPVQGASVITRERTVIVREEDAITQTIATAGKSLTRLYSQDLLGDDVFIGVGFIVGSEGIVATDAGIVSDETVYVVRLPDGSRHDARVALQDETRGVALLRLVLPQNDDGSQGKLPPMTPVSFGDEENLRLGQTVIAVGGDGSDSASIGIISSLIRSGGATATSTDKKTETLSSIRATISGTLQSGTPLFNLLGEVVGIASGVSEDFVPVAAVSAAFASLAKAR